MKYDVIYDKSGGSLARKSFSSAEGAFEFFWKKKGGANPQIVSDDEKLWRGDKDFNRLGKKGA
jgi:hypothetical protein